MRGVQYATVRTTRCYWCLASSHVQGNRKGRNILRAKDWKNFITRLIELDEPFNQKKGLRRKTIFKKICTFCTNVPFIGCTIYNWENNRTFPYLYSIPKIIKFLGYNPFDYEPKTLGEKLLNCRRILGISQKKLAIKLGVDPTTLARWKKGKGKPMESSLEVIPCFLVSKS